MNTPLNPPSRPRRGILFAFAAVAIVGAVTAVVVAGKPEQAEASGLAKFTSCAELEAWGAESQRQAEQFSTVGGAEELAGAPATSLASTAAPEAADRASSDDGVLTAGAPASTTGTNVVVAGVDELDVVDQLGGDLVLVTSATKVAVVDLAAGRVLESADTPYGAQVTYDAEADVAWVVGQGDTGVVVRRIGNPAEGFTADGEWTTPGMLVDARRVGDALHVVASDGFVGMEGEQVPFGGGPVPCGDVLHPIGPSEPTATLVATLSATGAVEPVRATEVVGSGQLVHVTTDAAYLATPQWDQDEASTTIHRFDLASLTHTGSGRVPGSLLNDFSMSDHDGYLRVAVTEGSGIVTVGRPILTDDMPVTDVIVGTDGSPAGGASVAPEPPPAELPAPEPTVTDTAVPETTMPEPTVPDTTVPETTVPETTVPETTVPPTTIVPEPTVPETTVPEPGDALNSVIVLDTEGDLDQVGATPAFGHPDETLQGIRFDGDVAYAVTFLQTDPFYVLDLADPTAPKVAGEVELPGFSSYLHPMGDGLVVGFGPDGNGRAAAKLFDVSDPAAPEVVDDLVLGDESAVTYDHHAFVDLGDGRFAVPAAAYRSTYPDRCTPEVQAQAQEEQKRLEVQVSGVDGGALPSEEESQAIYQRMDELNAEGCLYPGSVTDSSVVIVAVDGDQLQEVDRHTVQLAEPASRVIPSGDGWGLLTSSELLLIDADGAERATVSLS